MEGLGNEDFFARSRNSRNYAEAYLKYGEQIISQNDAEIAKKTISSVTKTDADLAGR